ncbi:MAG: hypothetical protein EOP12_00295 [Pseudomonas sp.]|jgi:hypothetical protein|nr:MAG: hypothetical protein EOP12_00295 [Pseudomonas sp.]
MATAFCPILMHHLFRMKLISDQRSAISDQRSAISDQRQMLNDLRKDSCKRASGCDCEEIAGSILICIEMQEEENLSYERISLDVG